ncbi:hypothetical protein [Acinetobacter sp. YH12045]|uniref:hypothetical protein n=1 Tax=Acinetobacter sp. YH12045 TaxID=2601051 RepID=UPI0015D2B7A8|nr:hypothetical protein [Acinetobacter sp. YH12045]
MSQEYPKMLYSGDKESYSSRIIHTAEEEQQFREIGLQDYADLPNPEPEVEEVATGETPQGFVTTEQFDAVAERLAAAESEIERLKQASAPATNDGVVNTNAVDYSNLSRDELRTLIVEQGKSYKQNDTIPQLIAILES